MSRTPLVSRAFRARTRLGGRGPVPGPDHDRPPGPGRGWLESLAPGLGLVALATAAAFALAEPLGLLLPVSPLVVGMVIGVVAVNTLRPGPATIPGTRLAARSLLRLGIVLLGLRLSLADLAGLGGDGLTVVALVVAVTFFGTRALARALGISPDLGLLVATGYSICGASAIAAVDGVVRADEEETAYAVSLVTLCGTLSVFVLPPVAHLLGLDGAAFGSWVGGAVHDVGQVVATASQDGAEAVEAATVVKLTRVALLAPLVAMIVVARRRSGPGRGPRAAETGGLGGPVEVDAIRRPPIVPLFLVGFLAAVALRSTGVMGESWLSAAAGAERVLLTMAMVALGLSVDLRRLVRLGGRPLLLGLGSWALVAGAAYLGVWFVGL